MIAIIIIINSKKLTLNTKKQAILYIQLRPNKRANAVPEDRQSCACGATVHTRIAGQIYLLFCFACFDIHMTKNHK